MKMIRTKGELKDYVNVALDIIERRERAHQIMREKNIKQSAVARKLGVLESSVSQSLLGRSDVHGKLLADIIKCVEEWEG